MKKLISGALLVVLLAAPGCCTNRNPDTQVSIDSYVSTLERVRTNLKDDVRPGYEEALLSSGVIPELVEARLGLVDDTLLLIDDALTGAADTEDGGGE